MDYLIMLLEAPNKMLKWTMESMFRAKVQTARVRSPLRSSMVGSRVACRKQNGLRNSEEQMNVRTKSDYVVKIWRKLMLTLSQQLN